jgi:hypothetical protein
LSDDVRRDKRILFGVWGFGECEKVDLPQMRRRNGMKMSIIVGDL